MKTIKSLLLLVILIAAISCVKEGPMGPRGPAGYDGADGIDANVLATNVVTVTNSNWTYNDGQWYTEISVPAITLDVVDYGAVYVFIQYGEAWWSLPDMEGVNTISYGFSDGLVRLLNFNIDGTVPNNPGTQVFRIIIVEQSYSLSSSKVDVTNYEQLKSALKLEE